MRFSFNIPYRNHITPYLNDNYILNMKNRRRYHMYLFVYKTINSGKPPYLLHNLVQFTHNHATRNTHDFQIPLHRTAQFQKSFSFVAPSLWNNLQNHVKSLSPNKFSNYIKKMLLEQQRH